MAPAAKKKPAAPAAVRAKQPIVWCLERADAEAGLEGWKPTIKVASEETVAAIAGAFEAAAARAAFRAAAAEEAAEAEEIEEEGEEEEEQGEHRARECCGLPHAACSTPRRCRAAGQQDRAG